MKQCPKCRTNYTDDGLRFCLADGAQLTSVENEQETVVNRRDQAVRVDIPVNEPTSRPLPAQPKSSSLGKIFAVAVALGLLLILVVAVAATLIYFGLKKDNSPPNRNIAVNPSPTTTPTQDPDKQRLQDELANIQRKLDEQQKNANRTPPPPPSPNTPGTVTARVNSPNDGFLALRDQPDDKNGVRIAKIPHGEVVTLENCNRNRVTIGGRAGRWCLVSWNGYEGYVFDAWLIY